jgi:hypothetical protein
MEASSEGAARAGIVRVHQTNRRYFKKGSEEPLPDTRLTCSCSENMPTPSRTSSGMKSGRSNAGQRLQRHVTSKRASQDARAPTRTGAPDRREPALGGRLDVVELALSAGRVRGAFDLPARSAHRLPGRPRHRSGFLTSPTEPGCTWPYRVQCPRGADSRCIEAGQGPRRRGRRPRSSDSTTRST